MSYGKNAGLLQSSSGTFVFLDVSTCLGITFIFIANAPNFWAFYFFV